MAQNITDFMINIVKDVFPVDFDIEVKKDITFYALYESSTNF